MSRKKKETEESAFELALTSRVDKCILELSERIQSNNLVQCKMSRRQYDKWIASYTKHWKKEANTI